MVWVLVFGPWGAPAGAGNVALQVDAQAARFILDLACSQRELDTSLVTESPIFQAQIRHHHRLDPAFTMDALIAALQSASRCEVPRPDRFRLSHAIEDRHGMERSVAFLESRAAELSEAVQRLIQPYLPAELDFSGSLILSAAGASCGGFAEGSTFFIDVPCIADDIAANFEAVKYLAAHETFHAIQARFFFQPAIRDPEDARSARQGVEFLLAALLEEGTAEHLADFREVAGGGGSFGRIFTDFTRRNYGRLRWNFLVFDYMVEAISHGKSGEFGRRTLDAYSIGFRGDMDQLFYYVGATMSETIEAVHGRSALVCLMARPPEQFVLAYVSALGEDGGLPERPGLKPSTIAAAEDLAASRVSAGNASACVHSPPRA